MGSTKFARFSWGLLAYTLVVIVWGAFVRASGSGDGCGNNWPHCGDTLIPQGQVAKTWVEFSHRISSSVIFGILILAALIWAFRIFPKGNPVRKAAVAAVVFTGIEALIGRALVQNAWVGADASVGRAIVLPLHLVNTFLLVGCIALMAGFASGIKAPNLRGQGPVGLGLLLGFLAVIVLGISGAISALGDTLFKAESLAHALHRDFSTTAHFLERLRPLHPLIAVSVGIYLILIAGLANHLRPSPDVKKYGQWLTTIFLAQIALGFLNLFLLAPIWMQLIHLFVADVLWICLTLMAASALAEGVEKVEVVTDATPDLGPRPWRQVVGEYVALTKPRVISLLLFTTLTAMFAAAAGWPGGWLFLAVAVGGYMSAGAANAINMVIDRDIDGSMKRTAKRPTVTQNISSRNALLFSFALAIGSFALLWSAANLLTALLALAGLAFYVVVYTLMLKRRTWHNIVIGGAAGAFPPLVGWASVTNEVSPLAWLLFGIIFVWTPVHFWALALLIKDDYAKAGIPMLPVVHGERATVIQIGLYAILTTVVSALPVLQPKVGWSYFIVAMLLNAVLLFRSFQLYQQPERPRAVTLYKYSMVYLALLFLTLAVDRAVWS